MPLTRLGLPSRVDSAQATIYAMLRQYPPSAWSWIYPVPVYPSDLDAFDYSIVSLGGDAQVVLISDSNSSACGCVASPSTTFAPLLNGTQPPVLTWGAESSLSLVYTFGPTCAAALALCTPLASPTSFASAWNNTEALWEERWQQAFTPNNSHYSGHLPMLKADAELERLFCFFFLLFPRTKI